MDRGMFKTRVLLVCTSDQSIDTPEMVSQNFDNMNTSMTQIKLLQSLSHLVLNIKFSFSL